MILSLAAGGTKAWASALAVSGLLRDTRNLFKMLEGNCLRHSSGGGSSTPAFTENACTEEWMFVSHLLVRL